MKHCIWTVSKISLEGLNKFNGTNITINSDVNKDKGVLLAWNPWLIDASFTSTY